MSNLETCIYIVGPKKNWELRGGHLKAIVAFVGVVFFAMAALSAYLYIAQEYKVGNLRQLNHEEQLKAEKLQETLNQLETKYEAELEELRDKLAGQNNPFTDTNVENSTIAPVQKQFKELQQQLKKKIALIDDLEKQNEQYLEQINTLTQQINDLRKENGELESSAEIITSKKPPISPVLVYLEGDKSPVRVDQFQFEENSDKLSIQFNLNNVTEEVQSGYIRINPLKADKKTSEIAFNSGQVSSFSIRRFRGFSKTFEKIPDIANHVIRITVWNRNNEKLLDQYYPLIAPPN